MTMTIKIDINRSFAVPLSRDEAFKVLADVPFCARQFPGLESLQQLEDQRFAWSMEKTGIDKHALKVEYACDYQQDHDRFRLSWEPVKGFGNTEVTGHWQVEEENGHSRCRLQTSLCVNMAAPAMLKMVISPVVRHTFNEQVDRYIANLKAVMGASPA